jgi:hypothetical protein
MVKKVVKKETRGKYGKVDKSRKYLSLTVKVDADLLNSFRDHLREEGITFRRAVSFLLEDHIKRPIKISR